MYMQNIKNEKEEREKKLSVTVIQLKNTSQSIFLAANVKGL